MSSLPASIKRIGSKTTKKRWRHHFPLCKLMGPFCCHGNQSFDPTCPKALCSLSLTPMMLHIKFDQDWPTGFRDEYSSSKVWNFRHSRASNSKISGRILPRIELDQAFMPVLVTSNFNDDFIKNEQASMETPFSHYKSGKFFWRSRAANSVVSGPIWPKFELVRDFMHVLVTCKYKKDQIKSNREKVETPFSPL